MKQIVPNIQHGGFNLLDPNGQIIGHFADELTAEAFLSQMHPRFRSVHQHAPKKAEDKKP